MISHLFLTNKKKLPMVSSLIDKETKWWKTSVVQALFLPFEADIILKIPLKSEFTGGQSYLDWK